MTATVTGKRGDQYLVDFGDGRGRIYDADEAILYPSRGGLASITATSGEPRSATVMHLMLSARRQTSCSSA